MKHLTPQRNYDKFLLAILILVAVAMSSCTQTKYIPIIHHQTKDSIVVRNHVDSIYINVKEYIKGNTIRKDSIVYRYIMRTDTICTHSVDSIPYIQEVIKEVPRKRTTYERVMIKTAWTFILLLVGAIVYRFLIRKP